MEKIASSLIKKLNSNGFSAYLVGGCVRDKLLSRPISDYDIATNATPDEIINTFGNDHKLVTTGLKHGTVTVIADGQPFEVTTFRIDDDYVDHRHPEKVEFVKDIELDLSRRDFTINALAYNECDGIIDYFGGIDDLNNKIIRAVGDPKLRFKEDALRILRAVRFSATLGFEIEDKTFAAMSEAKTYLKDVSIERIVAELTKTICGPYAAEALLKCKDILFEIIPEMKPLDGFDQVSLSHDYDVFNHTLKALSLCRDKNPTVCWALLLHDIGKPQCFTVDKHGYGHTKGHMAVSKSIAEEILFRFKFPKKMFYDVTNLIGLHDEDVAKTKYDVKKLICKFGLKFCWDLLTVKMADMYAHSDHGIKKYLCEKIRLRDYLKEITANNECCDFNSLDIDGETLLAIGFKGKTIGEVKSLILDQVMLENLPNEKNALTEFARSILNNF